MLKELFRPGAPFPSDRESAIKYVTELAGGIKIWIKIDILILLLMTTLCAAGIKVMWLGISMVFAIGCPTIMVLGFSVGFLRYLTPREAWVIVRKRLST